MKPGKYNMICPQGTTFAKQLTYSIDDVPVNLFGYTARMQVKENYKSSTPIINLTTENGGIVLGNEEGTIDLNIHPETTQTIIAKDYVYDLELVTAGNVYRLIEGKFIVTPEVTK